MVKAHDNLQESVEEMAKEWGVDTGKKQKSVIPRRPEGTMIRLRPTPPAEARPEAANRLEPAAHKPNSIYRIRQKSQTVGELQSTSSNFGKTREGTTLPEYRQRRPVAASRTLSEDLRDSSSLVSKTFDFRSVDSRRAGK